jgi:uracil-DNA glycosylase family 4
VTFVPGHIWGQYAEEWARSLVDPNYDPARSTARTRPTSWCIGKMPWRTRRRGRNLVGASGEILTDLIAKLHIKGAAKWYVTNLCKFMPPEDAGGTTLKAGWVHDCLPLLHQELRIVRPKYILCLGADASKGCWATSSTSPTWPGGWCPTRTRST